MKGKNNFEPMNFFSPQGQSIPFIKVLLSMLWRSRFIFISKVEGDPIGGALDDRP
jgi:hypothetical protein